MCVSEQDIQSSCIIIMKVIKKCVDEMGHCKIKGHMMTDGSNQRSYEDYEKSNCSFPTTSTDTVIMTSIIDVYEHRNVAVIDVENSYLQSRRNQIIIWQSAVQQLNW